MKKLLIAFLIGKFIEKIVDDGLKWDAETNGDYVTWLHEILAYWIIKNTPILWKYLP